MVSPVRRLGQSSHSEPACLLKTLIGMFYESFRQQIQATRAG
jgi:hypothetical protein